jgi:NADH-quinone oxidoreductase subunit N
MATLDYHLLLPFEVLTFTALAALGLVALRRHHGAVFGLTGVGLLAALATLPSLFAHAGPTAGGLLAIDNFAVFFFALILFGTLGTAVMAHAYLARLDGHREEFYILLLLAAVGAMTMAAATHAVTFFLGLETLSVGLYVLASYTHFRKAALEAGVKYLILAGASSAFLLFGLALLYASFGTLDFAGAAKPLWNTTLTPLVAPGLALFMVGFGFKLAVVPFHLWTPDVYQGAPAPTTAFIATVSKGATVAFALRLFAAARLGPTDAAWLTFAGIAAASMFAGNLLALRQANVKRLLAYSSIAHLGYVLVAFLAGGEAARQAVSLYLVAYVVTTLAAFGVVAALSGREREADRFDDYRSLFWRRPFVAAVFTAALLSLAGIPLTAGFIGKFFVAAAGVNATLWTLVLVLAVNSAIGLFYYLRLIAVMYEPLLDESPAPAAPRRISLSSALLLAGLSLLMLILGLLPGPLVTLIRAATIR